LLQPLQFGRNSLALVARLGPSRCVAKQLLDAMPEGMVKRLVIPAAHVDLDRPAESVSQWPFENVVKGHTHSHSSLHSEEACLGNQPQCQTASGQAPPVTRKTWGLQPPISTLITLS